MRLKPLRDRIEVLLRYAKALPELLGLEPFVEVRGFRVLEIVEELFEGTFLLRRTP